MVCSVVVSVALAWSVVAQVNSEGAALEESCTTVLGSFIVMVMVAGRILGLIN